MKSYNFVVEHYGCGPFISPFRLAERNIIRLENDVASEITIAVTILAMPLTTGAIVLDKKRRRS